MARTLTSNLLIESIKRRAMIPDNQVTFNEEDFLAFANDEIDMGMVPLILRAHEDYFLVSEPVPLETNVSEYAIPYRAIGNRLREVSYMDSAGNLHEMTRIEVQDLPDYNLTFIGNYIHAFYVKNNKVVIHPEIKENTNGSLVMYYYMRPNEIVSEDRAAIITNIDRITGVISVNSIPVDANSVPLFSIATDLDLVAHRAPFINVNFDILPTAVNITTNTITLNLTDIPATLMVGDYVNLASECIIPQIPADLHMQLAQRVAIKCLEAMGDQQAFQLASSKLDELNYNANSIIDNRVEGAPRKIVNKHSALRNGLYKRRFRFRG